jgi:putative ABC transport system permease protein
LQNPFNGVHIIVRSPLDVRAVTEFLQNSVWAVDKDLPVSKVRSMAEVISGTISGSRFRTWLMSAFAACGLTLTLIGIYGVISYSVSQRAHEMGIRMALGASRANLLKLVLGSGARMALLGAVIGIMGSLLLMRVLSSQLYAIKPNDPATLIVAALLLVAVALLASYIPARRASRVDPMVALRDE